jgi:hypothetical protein
MEGDSGFTKVLADPARSVGWLVDAVKAKFPSLRDLDATDITLHVLAADGATHGPALDATATVTEALGDPVPRKIRLVVNVAPTAAAVAAPATSAWPHATLLLHAAYYASPPPHPFPSPDTLALVTRLLADPSGAVEHIPLDHGASALRLKQGYWPGIKSGTLFVRDFYAGLYEGVLRRCRYDRPGSQPLRNAFTLHGTPGIGKSALGWYIIWRLLQEPDRPHIAYMNSVTGDNMLIPPTGPPSPWNRAGLVPGSIAICDTMAPPSSGVFALAISSTRNLTHAKDLDDFSRKISLKLAMAPWTLDELLQLNKVAFKLDPDLVRMRYKLWGGSARYVFADHHTAFAVFSDTVEHTDAAAFIALIANRLSEPTKVSGTFMHLVPAGRCAGSSFSPNQTHYYTKPEAHPASDALLAVAISRMHTEASRTALLTMLGSTGSPTFGALRGNIFESLLSRLVASGVRASLQRLPRADPAVEALSILPVSLVAFPTLDDLPQLLAENPRRHFCSSSSTSPAVDLILAVGDKLDGRVRHVPVQITVARTHSVAAGAPGSNSTLRRLARMFDWDTGAGDDRTPFVFAVPEALAEDPTAWRSAQAITTADSKASATDGADSRRSTGSDASATGTAGTRKSSGKSKGKARGDGSSSSDSASVAGSRDSPEAFFNARFHQCVWFVQREDLVRACMRSYKSDGAGVDPLEAFKTRLLQLYPDQPGS